MAEKIKSVSKCQCSGCHRFFVGTSTFDMHRTGKYEQNDRRCLTDQEMQSLGMATERRQVRFVREGKPCYRECDVWYSTADRERVQRVFGRGDEVEVEEEVMS